ncbi:glycosyltransferase family 4 protein [Qipengyuania atrilutea]|uniref:Glycosyltransferase family 4 protein n=1 Tax=Qipengyuania atrilutea TaxID=2744473 RepID=A0A850H604_9SPHN|nr:glycosyltransferase family 4 protein [Actirhodobacter atriluteus]NVD45288.1 glycosyltransferase family 4 protein [Actirhodobacter atriluteus]
MKQLADRLDAEVHSPPGKSGKLLDKVRSQFIGTPELWGYARELTRQFTAKDVVYCPDEEVGLPLAALCSQNQNGAKIALMVHNVDRPRARLTLKSSAACRSAAMYLAVSHRQLTFLERTIGIDASRTAFVADQTDMRFFTPGPPNPQKVRPLLVSAGLEKRDYAVLSEAVENLDVDVRITGFSADAKSGSSRFPQSWPSNFDRRRYEWTELVDLYRNADIVVVPVIPSSYAAGVTTIVEGMASRRPVIASNSEGLTGYLDDTDAILSVEPENPGELRDAIVTLLENPERAERMGQRGFEIAGERYSSEVHVENIAKIMEDLAAG